MRAKLLFAVSAAAFLAACANMDIPGVRGMTDTGSAFDAALHQAYSDLAQAEYDEADWADARYFTNRAKRRRWDRIPVRNHWQIAICPKKAWQK